MANGDDHHRGAEVLASDLLEYMLKTPNSGAIKYNLFDGIGRWLIVKHVANLAMESRHFDVLIWLKLPEEEQNPRNLQKRIAEQLRIEFPTTTRVTNGAEDSEESVDQEIVMAIHKKLKEKRFLLVLGDVAKPIDLTWVGVPNTMATGWRQRTATPASKVIFISNVGHGSLLTKNVHYDEELDSVSFSPHRSNVYKLKALHHMVLEEATETALSLQKSISGSYFTTNTVLGFLMYLSLIGNDQMTRTSIKRMLLRCWIAEGFITNSTPIGSIGVGGGGGGGGKMNGDMIATEEELILSERVMKPLLKELSDRCLVNKDLAVSYQLTDLLERPEQCEREIEFHYKKWKQHDQQPPEEGEHLRAISITNASLPPSPRWCNITALFIACSENEFEIPPKFFDEMKCLCVLLLDSVPITSLPSSISSLSNLRLLCLQNCPKLTALPTSLQPLKKLEFLLLSKCGYLEAIPQETFEQMSNLRHLDLSHTKIKSLPSSISNLSGLQLHSLSFCESLVEISEKSFGENMLRLEVVDLSQSSNLKSLPSSLSNLVGLKQLHLKSCSSLKTGLGVGACLLQSLSSLEVLDLEDCYALEDIENLSLGDVVPYIKYLRLGGLKTPKRLSLRGCQRLEHLNLKNNDNLQVLDLSGTSQLKELELKEGYPQCLQHLTMMPINYRDAQDVLFQGFNSHEHDTDVGARIWVTDPNILKNLSEELVSKAECFSRFHIRVSSSVEQKPNMPLPMSSIQGVHLHRIYGKGQYFHLQARFSPCSENNYDRHLEIYNCEAPLESLQKICLHVELLTLFDNSFVKSIRIGSVKDDALQMEELKECRIGSCQNMVTIFEKTNYHYKTRLKDLKVMWVSDLPQLAWVSRSLALRTFTFSALKHVHIERCPKLLAVFPIEIYLNSLEVLEIKFCSRLERVLGDERRVDRNPLQSLERLCLWELPNLKMITRRHLPKLQKISVRGCRKLTKLPLQVRVVDDDRVSYNATADPVVEIEGESNWWKKVELAHEVVAAVKRPARFRPCRLPRFTSPC